MVYSGIREVDLRLNRHELLEEGLSLWLKGITLLVGTCMYIQLHQIRIHIY